MPAITAKVVKGVPHFTVRSYQKKGGLTFTFNAVEEDNDKPVVLKMTNVESLTHAKTLAWTLGWIIQEPA